jgi:recombinational DNA repair protein RecT
VYKDNTRNRLVLVTKKDFDKSRKAAKTTDFWGKHETEMMYKTLVHRVTDKLVIDPKKVTTSFAAVEDQDIEVEAEISANANKDVIDVRAEPAALQGPESDPGDGGPISDEEAAEIQAREQEEAKGGPGY